VAPLMRVSLLQSNFTAGEISPRLIGRTDIDRYANAARRLINARPVIHGGAKRRGGTRFVAATKSSAVKSRAVPFVFSRDQAYMLVFADSNVRVYAAGSTGTLLAEVPTSYTSAMLNDIDFVQGADTMFIAHPDAPIQRLRRFSDVNWDLSAAPFTTTPFDEQGHALAATLTLSASTVGAGRTATASAGVFLPSDVGRGLVSGAGFGVVTGFTSATVVTVTITIAFAGVSLASGAWLLDVSPQALAIPSAKDPVASSINLTAALTRAANVTLSAKTGAITVTASAGVFAAGDVGKSIYADSGVAVITGFTSATVINVTTSTDFAQTSYSQGGYGLSDSGWRAEDVGKFVRINGGLLKITAFTSASAVRATIITALSSIIASPALAWSLESSVWSASTGYPRTVTLHEQRLIAAGTAKFPQTIWGSRTAEYFDFTKGTNDDDSYSFTIASDEINPISYVASLRNLVVHTYGGEFSLQGGVEKPITPTNVRVRPESAHGSRGVRPVLIGKESVFVQRAGRKVRAMGYRYDFDGYASPDLAVLAEHITASGVTGLAYQQEPDLTLWATRADGAMLSCTIEREQSVIGWAQHYTDGAFESVATIPNGEQEETWVIVRRVVNGATVRYIEVLNDTFAPMLPAALDPNAFPPQTQPGVYGFTVDAGLSFDNAAGQTVFAVPHLVGKAVDIVADGAVQPRQVVPPSGNVTLTRSSKRTLIGLPFRTEIELLTPEVGGADGTSQGNSMRVSELTLRFLDTLGAQVFDGEGNEQVVPFRNFGPAVLDVAPTLYTGLVRIEVLGWERGRSELTIVQDQPLPMHLLAVVRKFQTNSG
jgi:hypothetical protein